MEVCRGSASINFFRPPLSLPHLITGGCKHKHRLTSQIRKYSGSTRQASLENDVKFRIFVLEKRGKARAFCFSFCIIDYQRLTKQKVYIP